MFGRQKYAGSKRRRGVVAVLTVVALVTLVSMAALTIDVGMMYRTRAELQASADAGAMAAAWELLDRDSLAGTPYTADDIASARAQASTYAALNMVMNAAPGVLASDILVGYLNDPSDPTENLSFADPNVFNTVQVTVRRDAVSNGPLELLLAPVFGKMTAEISASASATFKNGVTGFNVPAGGPNAGVLPLAMHVDAWNWMMSGAPMTTDNWSYDPATGSVSAGSDGILEINLYPGGGVGQMPPGNFGTVDIGSAGNSTADLSRQIREGISPQDIIDLGQPLELGAGGSIVLNGDTGLSAAIKDDLVSIIGLSRTVPLFDQVTGVGNNSNFRIVGFGGIQVVDVKLTGPMNQKRVVVQAAFVVDGTAVTGAGASAFGGFVYQPVILVR